MGYITVAESKTVLQMTAMNMIGRQIEYRTILFARCLLVPN